MVVSQLQDLRAWRASLPEQDGIAVVTGLFDILHPGNLAALELADDLAKHVLVLLHPDEARCHSAEQRAAFLLGLRGVERVAQLGQVDVESLLSEQPYHMAVRAEGAETAFDAAVSAATLGVAQLDRAACDTADALVAAIQSGSTPIESPEFGPRRNLEPSGCRVSVNGCFDLLHLGHVDLLTRARAMGDHLTVLINSDASVQRYKGATRPVMPQTFRARALLALRAVDAVEIFDEDNPLLLLERLKPDIHVKGGSYEEDRVAAERSLLESWGGRIEMCPLLEDFSSSRIIDLAAT